MTSIAVLILAAGASTRMEGGPKQLLAWGDTTLLGHAIEQAKQLTESVFVVLGAHTDKIKEIVPKDVGIIHNTHWEKGMGSSISVGIKNILENHSNLSGILIMLADQPFLDASYLSTIKAEFENGGHKIVATDYGKKLGVPALFHPSLFSELSKLNQDFGARHIIEKYSTDSMSVFPEGKQIDIDTKKEYNQSIDNK
ncbi:nucleotidyltransferase family protein [Muricauda sp. CAU 1633]|uniref:nucleotidyltransferase family protein n=1 Tax=Allomuricauda sp. CAU 1633 TaxID=2816036 RepID=UPI001A8E03D5|nr:nucleotidyltransferase family protein [Muricauda sp. CAU 1633]MBO0323220.1 nucleotidyltransferase family protein [Muricauda sp. CAU 1633]